MKINIELDDTDIRHTFNRLLQAGADMQPLMRNIGETLLNSTRERFKDEESPDGATWEPLSAITKKIKKKNQDKVLTQDGHLAGQLTYRANPKYVEIGSTRIYASVHQFGATIKPKNGAALVFGPEGGKIYARSVTIPARPYLGVSSEDRTTIVDAVNDYLKQQLPR